MIFIDTAPLETIHGRYEAVYVVLSFIIATISSYVALDFALQLRREENPILKRYWHIGGAILIGAGVWCMHFTGMLAYNVGMDHNYDIMMTLLSLMLPIGFAYVIFAIINSPTLKWTTVLSASPILGAALLSMHYTGMAAMQMKVQIMYTPGWFLISVAIAIISSALTMWFIFIYAHQRQSSRVPYHLLSALIMGIGICGMHYSGMEAALLVPDPDCVYDPDYPDRPFIFAIAISVIMILIFAIAVGALRINEVMARHLKQLVMKRTEELETANQDLVKAKEMAESASIAKSEFLANMSHEIRTPMNAVIGITNILRNNMIDPNKREEFMETLQTSAESLLVLLNEILDISKIEANKIVLETIEFNLKELLGEIIALLSVRATEKNLIIGLHYDEMIGTMFRGDPLRIRQVVVNIISNAIKFTEEGRIDITVQAAKVDEERDGIEILIQDTGVGISDDKIKTIFEKFSQADASTTRKFGGTGLGLAISKALIEKMGGTVAVSSLKGKGSLFTLVLPLESVTHLKVAPLNDEVGEPGFFYMGPTASLSDSAPSEQAPILLVDDTEPNIMVTKSYLETMGYTVEVARNGREALAQYRRKKYALILMDIHMPELDGFDVTRAIREQEERSSSTYTPIIALTAFASVHDREKCMRHGMDDYISKPFRIEELKEKMQDILFLHRDGQLPEMLH